MAEVTKKTPVVETPPPVIHLELTAVEYVALLEGAYHLHRANTDTVADYHGVKATRAEIQQAATDLYNNLPRVHQIPEAE